MAAVSCVLPCVYEEHKIIMLHFMKRCTAQKMKFYIKDFFIKCDQIRHFLQCCFCFLYIRPRTFEIDRITIFIFSFCIGLVTQFNGPALRVLKHHYIIKIIRELLIGKLRFLIYNLLNQLLYYTVRKKIAFS